jgi:hypothetical protein
VYGPGWPSAAWISSPELRDPFLGPADDRLGAIQAVLLATGALSHLK